MNRKAKWFGGAFLLVVPVVVWWPSIRAASWRPQEVLRGPLTGGYSLVLSPRNDFLVADNTVWDLRRGALVRSLGSGSLPLCWDFFDEKSYWGTVWQENPARLTLTRRDIRTGRILWRASTIDFDGISDVQDICVSPNFRCVFVVVGSRLFVFDARTGRSLQKPIEIGTGGFFTDGGRVLFTSYSVYSQNNGLLRAPTSSKGKPSWSLRLKTRFVTGGDKGQVSPDRRVTWEYSSAYNRLMFWDVRSKADVWQVQPCAVLTPAFSSDGRFVAVCNWTGVIVFDAVSGKKQLSRAIPNLPSVNSIQLSQDGSTLYTFGNDGRVLRWRLR